MTSTKGRSGSLASSAASASCASAASACAASTAAWASSAAAWAASSAAWASACCSALASAAAASERDLRDDAVDWSQDRYLHLHRLENYEFVAFRDPLTGLDPHQDHVGRYLSAYLAHGLLLSPRAVGADDGGQVPVK